MKKILSTTLRIIWWLLLIAVFGSIGLGTDNPKLMVPLYALFLLILLLLFLYLNIKRRKQSIMIVALESDTKAKSKNFVNFLIGSLCLIASLFFPMFIFKYYRDGLLNLSVIFGFSILLLILGTIGVYIIKVLSQKNRYFQYFGYALIIITCIIPALAISTIDASFGTLGVVYFTIVFISALAWEGFNHLNKGFLGINIDLSAILSFAKNEKSTK
jgi:hypothetical protein